MRIETRHTALARSLDPTHVQPRDPSLINLPLPLPSIPLLQPLLTILVGGTSPSSSTQPAPPASTQPAATSAAPPASSSPSGGGSNGGGTQGGGSPSNGNPSNGNPSNGNPSNGDPSNGDPSNGSPTTAGGSDPSGGSPSSPGTSPSGSEPTSPASSSPSSTESTAPSGSATPSDPNTGDTPSGGSSSTGTAGSPGSTINLSNSGQGNGGDSSNGGDGGPVANAGALPATESQHGSASSPTRGSSSGTPSIGPNGLPLPSSSSGGGASGGGDAGTNTSGAASSKAHNSTGIIVGVIVALLFIFLGILILGRRRQRARREARRQNWWFARRPTSQTYGDRGAEKAASADALNQGGSGTQSVRSSFATTYDHSHSPVAADFGIPPLPPMAEVGRSDGTAPTLLIDVGAAAGAAQHETARFSIGSEGSGHSQYLVVTHRDSTHAGEMGTTPMSVRPFSPSESFAFPKPPDQASERNSAYSRPNSIAVASIIANSAKSPAASTYGSNSSIPPIPPAPTFPAPVLIMPNPFGADPVPFPSPAVASPNPFSDPSTSTNNPTTTTITTNNPFADPQTAPVRPATDLTPGDFADIEYIKRPFHPNLADEIRVEPDDAVRVLQTFDDGWAVVELVERAEGNEGVGVKGLIPLDCLREPGQPLPAFFAAKRVSSYSVESGSSESPFAFNAF